MVLSAGATSLTTLAAGATGALPIATAVTSPPPPASGGPTHYNWIGWAGNDVIYPTTDTNRIYVPPANSTAIYNKPFDVNPGYPPPVNDLWVNNSVAVGASNNTTGFIPYDLASHTYGLYYFWIAQSNEFSVIIPFFDVGGSNLTAEGNVPTEYEMGAVNGSVQMTGLSSNTIIDYPGGGFLGLNTTSGSFSTPGSAGGDATWLAPLIDTGLEVALAALDPEEIPIAALAIMLDWAMYLGAYDSPPSGVTDTSHYDPSGSSPLFNVWGATQGGSFNPNYDYCTNQGQNLALNCGKNVFGESFQLQSLSSMNPAATTPGTLQLSATNQLWEYDWGNAPPSPTLTSMTGATASVAYLVEPAVGIGGYVDLYPGGAVASSANVLLQQTCGTTLTDFDLATNATSGYWHFFADPGCYYTAYATGSNPIQGGTLTSPTLNLSYLTSPTGNKGGNFPVPNLNLDGGEVTFTEQGIISNSGWCVTLSGTNLCSTGSTVVFLEANGSHSYSVSANGYSPWPTSASSGSVTVAGKAVSVPISFVPLVTFAQYSLPSGTSWSVTLGGLKESSTGSTIVFPEPDGSYSYSVGAVSGYTVSPSSGTVTVSGSPVSVSITYSQVCSSGCTITFTESGLPSGSSWFVFFNGVEYTSTSTKITFSVAAGTYSWSVGTTASAPSGFHWSAAPPSGSMTVPTTTSQAITFSKVPNR